MITSFVLVPLFDVNLEDVTRKHPYMKAMRPLLQTVTDLLPDIHFRLRAKLVSDISKCFDEDSMAARLEEMIFEDRLAKPDIFVPALGNYVPLGVSQVEKDRFLKGMNELMKWADLLAQTLEQLLF
jgi:hypothetical protein